MAKIEKRLAIRLETLDDWSLADGVAHTRKLTIPRIFVKVVQILARNPASFDELEKLFQKYS